MTIYVVTKYGGSYEDKWEYIQSAYTDKQAAMDEVTRINENIAANWQRYKECTDDMDPIHMWAGNEEQGCSITETELFTS